MEMERVTRYLNCIGTVETATIDTEATGTMTLHLIPMRMGKREEGCILILNGSEMVKLEPATTVMMALFIREINKHAGKRAELEEADWEKIENETCNKMSQIFSCQDTKSLRETLNQFVLHLSKIAEGYAKYTPLVLEEYWEKMSGPIQMDLMVSSAKNKTKRNCNQRCKHCSWGKGTLEEVSELPTDSWKKIMKKLWNEARVTQLNFIGGGEPTMREDLPELIKSAENFVTCLETNGIKLADRDYCTKLKNANLNLVKVTLYSDDAEVHNKVVGTEGALEQTVRGIKNALTVGMNVTVKVPVQAESGRYENTLKFLKELGVTSVECIAATDEHRYVEYVRTLEAATAFCKKNKMNFYFSVPGKIPEVLLSRLGLEVPLCGACLFNMAIAPNGSVIPCAEWNNMDAVIRNILYSDWNGIWNNEKTKRIRRDVARNSDICRMYQYFI